MRTVTNIFIVNLAIADLLVIILCLPPTVVWDVSETWFLGSSMCKAILYLQVRDFQWTSNHIIVVVVIIIIIIVIGFCNFYLACHYNTHATCIRGHITSPKRLLESESSKFMDSIQFTQLLFAVCKWESLFGIFCLNSFHNLFALIFAMVVWENGWLQYHSTYFINTSTNAINENDEPEYSEKFR